MYTKTANPYKFNFLITGITGEGIKEVYLPEKPSDDKILFKAEQKWTRPAMPDYLKKAAREWIRKSDPDSKYFDPNYISPYERELAQWEEREWNRTEEGVWFWNKGIPTYITRFYYFYLSAWETYFGFPDYRETDKEITYWIQYWEEDPNSFGGLLNTIRRYGKSALMGCWEVFRTIRNKGHYSGAQGENDDKIYAFYNTHILQPFHRLPYYYKPTYDVSDKQTEGIQFQVSPKRGQRYNADEQVETLNSYLDYRVSKESAYDQAVLHTYVGEELGKCHPKGTMIKMYDGSIKAVEDIVIGDKLRGDDNEPRIVLNNGFGRGKIYKIIPNSKADPWYVNEHHILSCKVSGGTPFKGYKKGDVINISIKTFLSLSQKKQAHLMCYRVGVEYSAKRHFIHPYTLGLWLGDGSSSAPCITNIDHEISEWLYSRYDIKKIKVTNRAQGYYIRGGMATNLKNMGLHNNKHIPKEYLIDSRENRLLLLAGLIDTDGHRSAKKNQRHYEIIQKNKRLAEDIKELALSLGFYASCNPKRATMKRKDGSIYESTVYRVHIFGQLLYEVPCRIERKKMPHDITTYNSKDPQVYGFKVEYDRIDDYYGFNISGNHLYLLHDYTVTHNTLVANVNERWKFVKPCLKRGKFIRGKAFGSTTVEFMDTAGKGGKAYKKLFYESDFDHRNALGQTVSGLYVAFLPGDCALEGYFDEWGFPIRDEAKKWILAERDSVKSNPKDHSDLIRKYPLTIKEIFYINADRCEFNATILQDRKSELEMDKNPTWSRYDAYWENNIRFSKIRFRHNPTGGWLKATWLPMDVEKETNLVKEQMVHGEKVYVPRNDHKFEIGFDPIEHGVVIEGKTGSAEDEFMSARRSKPVLYVKSKYDSTVDGEITQAILEKRAEQKYQYKTNRFFLQMDNRPNDPNVLFERVLMICWYFGASVHVESQKYSVINYFNDHNCGPFIMNKYEPEWLKNKSKLSTEGTPASQTIIQDYTSLIATYVEYFGHTIPFTDLIEDLLLFNPRKTTEYDYAVAMGFTLLAGKIQPKIKPKPLAKIESFLPMVDHFGNPLN